MQSIAQDSQIPTGETPEFTKAKQDPGAFYRDRGREIVRGEVKIVLKTQGVYTPARWAKRWDFVVAGYLAYFVSWLGYQKSPDGWIYKSAREMQDECGITPHQQERCRRVLERVEVIETKKGGIGNKLHVRVNLTLLMLMDEMESVAVAVEAEGQNSPATDNREPLPDDGEPLTHKGEPLPDDGEPLSAFRETHNRNTQKHSQGEKTVAREIRGEAIATLCRRERRSKEKK